MDQPSDNCPCFYECKLVKDGEPIGMGFFLQSRVPDLLHLRRAHY